MTRYLRGMREEQRRQYGVKGKLVTLYSLLSVLPWCDLPLHIQYTDQIMLPFKVRCTMVFLTAVQSPAFFVEVTAAFS